MNNLSAKCCQNNKEMLLKKVIETYQNLSEEDKKKVGWL